MKNKFFAMITGTAMAAAVTLSSVSMTAFAASPISAQQAQQIAYRDAGVNAMNVTYPSVKKDFENGRQVYEVKFYAGSFEYDYDIDVYSGTVVDRDIDGIFDD